MRKTISLLIAFVLILFSSTITNATEENLYTIDQPHVYTIKPGTDAWRALDGALEKREACYVSRDEIEKMTTEALTITVLKYPLLVDMYAYDTIEEGINTVCLYFSGLKELLKRSDALLCLQNISRSCVFRDENTDLRYYFADTLIEYLLKNRSSYPMSKLRKYDIQTPEGNYMPAFLHLDWTDHDNTTYALANSLSYTYQSVYNVTCLAGVDPEYNCHSYAFYSQLTSNSYWIELSPQVNNTTLYYVTDGSYTYEYTAGNGYRITYYTSSGYNHSGIVYSAGNNYSTTIIESKWGNNALFRHAVTECPYYGVYTTGVYYWSLTN